MHLRFYGKAEILDVVVPDGSYVVPSGGRFGRRQRQRLVVPWHGSEIGFSAAMVPILATLGEFGMKLHGVLRRTDQVKGIS
ncbi:MAG: hypothetical protein U0800_21850 [Isosphaeraceae bacterium]